MSTKYWSERSNQRLSISERKGNGAIIKTSRVYQRALNNIQRDIESVYSNYARKGILEKSDLDKALTTQEKSQFVKKLERKMLTLGINPKEVLDERYLSRLTRLKALQDQIRFETMSIAPSEERIASRTYREVITDSYSRVQKDLEKQGVSPNFSTLNRNITNAILNSEFKGSNYSARIWNNVGELSTSLPIILGGALTSGQSYQKTVREIRDQFNVKRYESLRLVRSETNYFHNQAELQSYVDDGIERYTFDATLDNETSDPCRRINGNVYFVKDAQVGENYPPMLPNCRSTTTVVLEGEQGGKPDQEKRLARFKEFKAEALKERWRKAMGNQMDNSTGFNAEMNNITQKFRGQERTNLITDLMIRIPRDNELRPALERVARTYGWADKREIKTVRLNNETIPVDKKQIGILNNYNVRVQSGFPNVPKMQKGGYDYRTNTLFVSKDVKGKELRKIFTHELGHVVDLRAGITNSKGKREVISKTPQFERAIKTEGYSIVESRLDSLSKKARDFSMKQIEKYVDTKGKEGNNFATSYYFAKEEIFADAFRQYIQNKDMKKYAPKTYDLMNKIYKKL